MRSQLAAIALGALLAACPAYANNLIVNGSFETTTNFNPCGNSYGGCSDDTMVVFAGDGTTMPGWTVFNNQLAWIGPANPFALTASDGSYFLDLTSYADPYPNGPFGGVEQSVATVNGGSYQLTFDIGGSVSYGVPDSIQACAGLTCQVFSISATGTNDWALETLSFTGTGSPMEISLLGFGGIYYIGLDNVSVSGPVANVPEPGTLALFGVALLALGGLGLRRKFV